MRVFLCTVVLAFAATASAQNHNGGTFSVTALVNNSSYGIRTDPLGSFTTMRFPRTFALQCEMYADNRLVLVPDAQSGSLWQIDPMTMSIVGTLVTNPILMSYTNKGLDYDHNGDLWMSTAFSLIRISPAGAVTIVSNLGSSQLASDPLTGELLIFIGNTLSAVDRNTGRSWGLASGFQLGNGDFVRDPLSGDIYVPTCCAWQVPGKSLYVLRNGASVPSIYVSDMGFTGASGPQLDRVSAANRRIIAGSVHLSRYWDSGGMWTIDLATGTPTRFASFNASTTFDWTVPTVAALSIMDSTILGSRNLHSTRTGPGQYTIDIDIQIDRGRDYVLGFSLGGPSPAMPLADGRRLPLVFDNLTLLTVTNRSAPFVTGTVGTLDAAGRATANVNLGPLTNALRKTSVWMCAVTFDNRAPLGISIITDPKILKFD